jgi:N-acetylmuramoyl-L-alanine amidase
MNARGFSVYTTKGKTRSDLVAETIMSQLIIDFPELKSRPDKSDGDLDQEEDFTVIKKTNCPSVLIEWNFQDNKEDVDILLSSEYNSKFIKSLIKSINTLNDVLTQ